MRATAWRKVYASACTDNRVRAEVPEAFNAVGRRMVQMMVASKLAAGESISSTGSAASDEAAMPAPAARVALPGQRTPESKTACRGQRFRATVSANSPSPASTGAWAGVPEEKLREQFTCARPPA
jgi:hypothetical protein